VQAATEGRLTINVHANGSLFEHPQIWDAVADGRIAAGELLTSSRTENDPIMGVDSVPFLATSYADASRLYKVSAQYHQQRFKRAGLIPLYSVPWPPQGLFLSTPIHSTDDLRGLRVRTYNQATSHLAELLGGMPAMIEFRDLRWAFQRNQVDAMLTSATGAVETKAWEFVRYFYDLQVWLRYPNNYQAAVQEIIGAGGDTDTAAAILGGIIGAREGKNSIPEAWIKGVVDWPRDLPWIERLGQCLAKSQNTNKQLSQPGYLWPFVLLRNLFFISLVLFHGFRRMLPPY